MAINAPTAVVYLGRTATVPPGSSAPAIEPSVSKPVAPQANAAAMAPTTPQASPPAGSLPLSEPAPQQTSARTQKPTPEELAIAEATTGSPATLLSALRGIRERSNGRWVDDKNIPTELAEMASAMAQALGMSEEEARLLVDAMSRGGPDARTLAEGVNALRGMPRAERTDWRSAWLPSAKAAASVIVTLADTTTARSLGVSDAMVEALAEAARRTFMMVNRKRSGLVDGMTVAEGAERIRKQTEKRVGSAKGADAILSEVAGLSEAIASARAELRKAEDELASIPRGGGGFGNFQGFGNGARIQRAREAVDQARAALQQAEANQRAFVTDVASRYDVTFDQAKSLVDAMLAPGDVGRMIASGLHTLEQLDASKTGFAATFFEIAQGAAAARAAAHADVFSRELNVMTAEEAAPIAELAKLNAVMADNLKLKAKHEAQAKPSSSLSTSAGGQTATLRIVG